jgi:hypothetical protein
MTNILVKNKKTVENLIVSFDTKNYKPHHHMPAPPKTQA